jgi:hypothetical protein
MPFVAILLGNIAVSHPYRGTILPLSPRRARA